MRELTHLSILFVALNFLWDVLVEENNEIIRYSSLGDLPECSVLPWSSTDSYHCLNDLKIETNKSENSMLLNDEQCVILTTDSNLECVCKTVDEIFVDETFKSCPKYFINFTLFTDVNMAIMPLLLSALLPSKS